MEIDHKVENGIINIAIKGRLDAATSPVARVARYFRRIQGNAAQRRQGGALLFKSIR
jgi:hypothetical protein